MKIVAEDKAVEANTNNFLNDGRGASLWRDALYQMKLCTPARI
jgi:hypothetical protein